MTNISPIKRKKGSKYCVLLSNLMSLTLRPRVLHMDMPWRLVMNVDLLLEYFLKTSIMLSSMPSSVFSENNKKKAEHNATSLFFKSYCKFIFNLISNVTFTCCITIRISNLRTACFHLLIDCPVLSASYFLLYSVFYVFLSLVTYHY